MEWRGTPPFAKPLRSGKLVVPVFPLTGADKRRPPFRSDLIFLFFIDVLNGQALIGLVSDSMIFSMRTFWQAKSCYMGFRCTLKHIEAT